MRRHSTRLSVGATLASLVLIILAANPAAALSNVWRWGCSAGSAWKYRAQWTQVTSDGIVRSYDANGVQQAQSVQVGNATYGYYVPFGGNQPSYTVNASGVRKNYSTQGNNYPCL